jgi:hypothetical protein
MATATTGGMDTHNQEHQAMMNLVPANQVTDQAVRSGAWSNASTWSAGVPGANANVSIPANITVTYDVNSTVSLHWVRVDGTLQFVNMQNTGMLVETLVVPPSGTLIIGTKAAPIANGVSANITFADNGPLNTSQDPYRMGRGLVAEGMVTMFGAIKTSYVAVNPGAIPAGTTTLQMSSTPTNWQVGDDVVLTGATPGFTQEERTIKAISGRSVTLNTPLTLDHTPPSVAGLVVYLANYTRNITFRSANTHPINTTADFQYVARRGHVMFMHTAMVNLNYVQFSGLGRTNKAEYTDNLGEHIQINGYTEPGTGLNPRGRYAVHFHHVMAPATLNGCAITGSMGWGAVDHGSNVTMTNNAAYDILGAAFVAEDGSAQGLMKGNIAIDAYGSAKYGIRTNIEEPRHGPTTLGDLWNVGLGFAFRGQLVGAENNIVANVTAGVEWNDWDDGSGADIITPVPSQNLLVPQIANNAPTVDGEQMPVLDFHNNTVFASGNGVIIDGMAQPTVGDARSYLDGLKIWNVGSRQNLGFYYGWNAIHIMYAGRVTISNAFIYNDHARLAADGQSNTGITVGPNTEIVISKPQINGFDTAINNTDTEGPGEGDADNPAYTTVLDSTFTNDGKAYSDVAYNLTQGSLSGSDLTKLSFAPDANPDFSNDTITSPYGSVTYQGTITDTLGSYPVSTGGASWDKKFYTPYDSVKAVVQKGYYTRSDGTPFIVLQYEIFNRVTEAHLTVNAPYIIDKTHWQGVLGPNLGTYHG